LASLALALLVWPVAIAILVRIVATDEAIEHALLITAGTFVVALAFLGWGTWATSRRDRAAPLKSEQGSQ
jgi:type VI protein secretion system component VasK